MGADVAGGNAHLVDYSYSVENLAEHPELTLVAWPRSCGPDGHPLGDMDLDLNPQLEGRIHDMDYEIVRPEGSYEVGKFCGGRASLYGLDARAFPVKEHVSEEDDWTLSLKKGDKFWASDKLDSMSWIERIPFFEKNEKVRRSKYRFKAIGWVTDPSPLRKAHDVLRITKVTPTEIEVVPVKITYGFDDQPDETVMYSGTTRPEPSQPNVMLPPEPSAAPAASSDAVRPGPPPERGMPQPEKRGLTVLIIAGALAVLYFALRLRRRPE